MSLFDEGNTGDTLPDFVQDEAPAETPEVVEEAPALPVLPIDQPVVDEPVVATEEPETPVEKKVWAGKYQDPEQLEKGYRELRDLQRRTAERAKAYEQRAMEIEEAAKQRTFQLEDALRRAIPLVQQAVMQQQQPQIDEYGNPIPQTAPQPPPLTPQMVAPMVDQMVQQRLTQAQQQAATFQAQQKDYQEAATALQGFFERHPEVEPRGSLDNDIADTILALNEAWAEKDGSSVDISSDDSLEIAYEAAQRPALRKVLELNPAYIDDDEGMALARQQASLIEQQTQTQPTPQAQVPARTSAPRPNTPFVERGSAQAPQPGTPLDEFEQAAAEYAKLQRRGGDSVFF